MTFAAGLPLKENFVQELLKGKVFERMKNIYHIAASVTPLVALLSHRFQNFSAKRYHFIAVSHLAALLMDKLYEQILRQAWHMETSDRPFWLQPKKRFG